MNKEKKKRSILGTFSIHKWLIYIIIPTIYLLFLTVIVIRASLYTNEEAVVSYNEIGDVDYKVYLKDNNYYQTDYLDKGMQYISSIIDYIDIDFNYELHSQETMNFNYTYNIKADLLITDPNDNNKLLYKKTTSLVEDKKIDTKSNNFTINENIDVVYDEYNNYVNNFKKEYGLSIKSRLLLTMEINITGKSKVLKDDFNKTDTILISIPMSEQTISVSTDTSSLDSYATLDKNYLSLIKKPVLFCTGIVVGILSLILLYISLYTLLTSRTKKDIYKSIVGRILKEYDRAIVTSTSRSPVCDKQYKTIDVSRFEELLDAHDTTGSPILYNEIIKNERCQFTIIDDDVMYRLILDRIELEEEEKKRIEEKEKQIENKIKIFKLLKKK